MDKILLIPRYIKRTLAFIILAYHKGFTSSSDDEQIITFIFGVVCPILLITLAIFQTTFVLVALKTFLLCVLIVLGLAAIAGVVWGIFILVKWLFSKASKWAEKTIED